LSVRETKNALARLLERESESIMPAVYELRFIKLAIRVGSYTQSLWVYLGRESDYLIIPGVFCSCKDFIMRTVINKTSSYCKHQAGVYMASKRNKYLTLSVTPEEAYDIVFEILNEGMSLKLRRRAR